jgi:hypothetical protein
MFRAIDINNTRLIEPDEYTGMIRILIGNKPEEEPGATEWE